VQNPNVGGNTNGGWKDLVMNRAVTPDIGNAADVLASQFYVPFYLRENNFYRGDICHLIAVGSPFRGSPFADVAEPRIRPDTLRGMALGARRNGRTAPRAPGTQGQGDLDTLGVMVDVGTIGNVGVAVDDRGSTGYYDLRTDCRTLELLRDAHYSPWTQWLPAVGIVYQPPGLPPAPELLRSLGTNTFRAITPGAFVMDLPDEESMTTRWFQCGDGMVSAWSQVNFPNPGADTFCLDQPPFHLSDTATRDALGLCIVRSGVYHSSVAGSNPTGEGNDIQLRREILRALSSDTSQFLNGPAMGNRQ